MKSLKDMQLILKVDGKIAESNITEFEIFSNKILDGINTDLNTDKDFILAKDNIKDLKEVEIRIANAKQNGVMSMEEVAAVMTTIDKMSDRFRTTRLGLEKKVKSEETRRKSEIVNAGIAKVESYLSGSWVWNGFRVGSVEIKAAIKGKRSLAKMEEAVAEEAEGQIIEIRHAEEVFVENSQAIEKSEQNFPGLFPDWQDISLSTHSHVLTTIQAREEKFKNDNREAEERAAAKKAEEGRLAKEKADKIKADRQEKAEEDGLAKFEVDMAKVENDLKAQIFTEPAKEYPPLTAERAGVSEPLPKAEKEIRSHRGMVVEKQAAESQPATFKSPPTFTEPPPVAANPFVDADISPPKPKTVTLSVEVEASLATEISDLILTMDGVLCVRG